MRASPNHHFGTSRFPNGWTRPRVSKPERRPLDVSIPTAGEPAPDFTAPTDADTILRLADLRGRWVILFFYPKDDTST